MELSSSSIPLGLLQNPALADRTLRLTRLLDPRPLGAMSERERVFALRRQARTFAEDTKITPQERKKNKRGDHMKVP